MPTLADVTQILNGQYFGKLWLPQVDLTGKTVVVTGGNTGLGFDCAKHLVTLKVANLILACRNLEKGTAAKQGILDANVDNPTVSIEVWEVDLDHYDSVIAFNNRIRSQLTRLDGFVANAGIELENFELSEGCERSLTVNVISTFLIAFCAFAKLNETATEHSIRTNLSFVGSMGYVFAPEAQLEPKENLDTFAALSDAQINRSMQYALFSNAETNMSMRYPLSKLIQLMCFLELAENTEDLPVTINTVNPGWCLTELSRYKYEPMILKFMAPIFRRTSEEGARTLIHGVTAGSETHGQYLSECQVKEMSAYVRSPAGIETRKRIYGELLQRLEIISPNITSLN